MTVESKEFDIFTGSKIGSLKHLKYNTETADIPKKCIKNLQDIKSLQKGEEITSMRWADTKQTQIVLARQNRTVQVYDTRTKEFKKTFVADIDRKEPGEVVGAVMCEKAIVTGLSCGVVQLWSKKKSREWSIDTHGPLDCMRQCPDDPTLIATGGKENKLAVWKVGEEKSLFMARNMPDDWLQLRVPFWISDLCFMPGTGGNELVTCSRYGFIRLYDIRTPLRRPECTVEIPDKAATCITPSFLERMVVVGFSRGHMNQIDFRGKGRLDKGYKGSVGAVTDISIHREKNLILSVSLDRIVKVHDATSKQLLCKQYLTSKLSCLLVQTESTTPMESQTDEDKVVEEKEEEFQKVDEAGESDKEYDEIFESMQTIQVKTKRKQPDETQLTPSRKKAMKQREKLQKKQSKEQTEKPEEQTVQPEEQTGLPEEQTGLPEEQTEQEQEEPNLDESIKLLLRSTEKKKKKIAKLKKEKRARSIYHNA